MKPINMNDGRRQTSGSDTSSAMGSGIISYNEIVAEFASEHKIKYRYAFYIVNSDIPKEDKVSLVNKYKKIV